MQHWVSVSWATDHHVRRAGQGLVVLGVPAGQHAQKARNGQPGQRGASSSFPSFPSVVGVTAGQTVQDSVGVDRPGPVGAFVAAAFEDPVA